MSEITLTDYGDRIHWELLTTTADVLTQGDEPTEQLGDAWLEAFRSANEARLERSSHDG